MAALERVMQMRQRGIPESQIAQSLREEGFSPREINESLSQSKIKSALVENPEYETFGSMQPPQLPEPRSAREIIPPAGMQPSIMPMSEEQQENSQPYYPEQTSEQYAPVEYPQEQYQEYPEYSQSTDIETMNDIAEQIVEEKTAKLRKQISTFARFKDEISIEIQSLIQRIEKLENNFNEIQMAVLRKIGEYGEDVKNISKEMRATQDTFSKIVNPIIDKKRKEKEEFELAESEEIPKEKTNSRDKRKKPAENFESYLR